MKIKITKIKSLCGVVTVVSNGNISFEIESYIDLSEKRMFTLERVSASGRRSILKKEFETHVEALNRALTLIGKDKK